MRDECYTRCLPCQITATCEDQTSKGLGQIRNLYNSPSRAMCFRVDKPGSTARNRGRLPEEGRGIAGAWSQLSDEGSYGGRPSGLVGRKDSKWCLVVDKDVWWDRRILTQVNTREWPQFSKIWKGSLSPHHSATILAQLVGFVARGNKTSTMKTSCSSCEISMVRTLKIGAKPQEPFLGGFSLITTSCCLSSVNPREGVGSWLTRLKAKFQERQVRIYAQAQVGVRMFDAHHCFFWVCLGCFSLQ